MKGKRRCRRCGIHPSSFILHPSPSGVTLIEVLFSIGILLVGLWGVAVMIPLGKLALVATEKSDRTGACGRAALHDVKVRNLVNAAPWIPSYAYARYAIVTPRVPNGRAYQCTSAGTSGTTDPAWTTVLGSTVSDNGASWVGLGTVFVVDPLGILAGLPNTFGGTIPRISLGSVIAVPALAESIFRWHDDWKFVLPGGG